VIVVDATAFAAFLLREPQGDAVLEQMLAHDAMLAPGLLAYELANVIAQAQRSGRLDDAAAERAREQCAGFPWVFEQHASRDRAASLSALCARHGVSAYRAA
jgi:predicted nucleic acid-binding protein